MKKQKIVVGNQTNPESHLKLSDRSVSRSHAEIMLYSRGTLLVKDLESKYGTYVNGRRIRSKLITKNDLITFGHTTYSGGEFILEYMKIVAKDKVHWEHEFDELEQTFRKYRKKKSKLKNKYKTKVALARIFIFILFFFLFSFLFDKLGVAQEYKTLLIIGASMLAAIAAGFFVPQSQLTLNLEQVEEEYEDLLTCPNLKCDYSLKSKPYRYWRNKRKCPKCKANWVVE